MSCIDKIICGERVIIGVRDFDECATPESGYFLNDLPQVSFMAAAKIAGPDELTAREVFKKAIRFSSQLVFDDFKNKVILLNQWQDDAASIPMPAYKTTTQPPQAKDKGIILRRYRSELGQIFIGSIYVKVKESGVGTLKIVDGAKTKEYNIDLLPDQVCELNVNYRATNEEIKILLDNTSFSPYDCPVNSTGNSGCYSCSGKSLDVFMQGWNGTTTDSSCHGITVSGSVRCYVDNLLCGLIGNMYTLFLYRAGIVFLDELINSPRINFFTNFKREQAKESRAELMELYDERFASFVKSSQNYIRTLKADCIKCNSNKYVQVTP